MVRTSEQIISDCLRKFSTTKENEVDDEQKKEPEKMNIERRVALAIAVGQYLRTLERFSNASNDFNLACERLRSQLGKKQKLVAQVECKHYIVSSDDRGNFNVEFIEAI